MTWMVVLLAAFFLIASVIQLYQLQARIYASPPFNLRGENLPDRVLQVDPGQALNLLKWQSLISLESHAVARRYHQANALLVARVWTQYLGFLTGMILAFVGATFILGKLSEKPTEISGGGEGWRVAIDTSSPGLVLVLLGTVLMMTTILVRREVKVADEPLYTVSELGGVPGASSHTAPALWPGSDNKQLEEIKRKAEELLRKRREGGGSTNQDSRPSRSEKNGK